MIELQALAGFAVIVAAHSYYTIYYWRTIDAINPGNHPLTKESPGWGVFVYLVGLLIAWFSDNHLGGMLVGSLGAGWALPGYLIHIHKWKYRDEYERVRAQETLEGEL